MASRWRIPPAAVLVHLCIGSVYAWSVFNRPIHELNPGWPSWLSPPYTTFSTALVLLGLSAAFGGPWVERRGPRVAATASALFFGGGLLLASLALRLGSAWLLFLGAGVVSGIGCGLGYIAPVSTLVKWFPDRRGMATGLAVMGFGGGALLAGAINVRLMAWVGVPATFLILGVAYLLVILLGAALLRRPPEGYSPPGYQAPPKPPPSLTRNQALRTPQFWLLYGMLFINVTAGIGILAQASPMMQDMFGKSAAEAGTTISIISLFNAGGRFFWASLSDRIGRRVVYLIFFVAQAGLFLLIPTLGQHGSWLGFQLAVFVIFTMYGGGFATVPAFLADLFGAGNVGAIHGAVLTAWSAAAVAGPALITQLSRARLAALPPGASRVHIYDVSLYLICGLLLMGVVLALRVRPLPAPPPAGEPAPPPPRR